MSQALRLALFPALAFPFLCAVAGSGCSGPPAPPPDSTRSATVILPDPRQSPDSTSAVLDPGAVDFADVAAVRGLDYAWPEQPRPMRALEAFGCGCAAFDADDDGWQDVLLVGDPHPVLFRNVDGLRFEKQGNDGLQQVAGNWKGCAIGDYDGDGLLDVLLIGYRCLALYRNAGGLQFRLVTAEAGLDPGNHRHWGSSAGFMDLDGDGWLDLVLLNCIDFGPESRQYCEFRPGVLSGCIPRSYPPERGEIWRNTGQGSFEMVPDTAGMKDTRGVGLVLAFTDIDDDGRMDFYVGNDAVPADFLHNLGGLQFENNAAAYGLAVDGGANEIAAMGADWADFDRDGRLDLAVSNFQLLSFVVFRNVAVNCFVDASVRTDLSRFTRNRLGFGTKWVDFENDGWPDLFFVNGHVYDNAAEVQGAGVAFRQPICLLRNAEGRKFLDLVPGLGADIQRAMVGRGSATADFNNDGLIDLLAVDYEGPVMLLENRSRSANHWLTIDLRAAYPNRFAYGAHVVGQAGSQVWLADVSPASSYLSSSDPRIHWGLGQTVKLDTLTIRWPSGREQVLHDVAGDRILRHEEHPNEQGVLQHAGP
jgi:hypothetical protein